MKRRGRRWSAPERGVLVAVPETWRERVADAQKALVELLQMIDGTIPADRLRALGQYGLFDQLLELELLELTCVLRWSRRLPEDIGTAWQNLVQMVELAVIDAEDCYAPIWVD